MPLSHLQGIWFPDVAHALHYLSSRIQGHRCWGHPFIDPYLKREGAGLALRAFHWSSIHCQQARLPTSCNCQGAGSKSGWWGVLSPLCGATPGSVPYLELRGGESEQQEPPDPAVGRALGRPLQLRTSAGPLLLAVFGASVCQALGRGWPGLWRPRQDACGITHMRTHCHSPRKEVPVPSLGQGMD